MPSEVTLKVLAYNVQMLDQAFWLHHHNTERAGLIGDILARSDYDVIIFSEAFDNKAREELIKRLQKTFPQRTAIVGNDDDINASQLLVASFVLGGLVGVLIGGLLGWATGRPKSDGGVFIVSRWPIVLQGQIVYRNSASEDRMGRKGVSWALINKQGFHFNVFGTHTQADKEHAWIRQLQFDQVRMMYGSAAPNWQPVLVGGDLNVDFCFERDRCAPVPPPVVDPDPPERGDRPGRVGQKAARDLAGAVVAGGQAGAPAEGCCHPNERDEMLRRLGSAMPRELSKYTYTRDRKNDLHDPKGDKDLKMNETLDYVVHSNALDHVLHPANPRPSPLRPQPLRSSLETVKYRARVDGRERDLSDHFGVVGTYTFPFVREDSNLFTGTWRCVKLDGQPDTRNHRMTVSPFGKQVLNELDGKTQHAQVHKLYPGKESYKGKILFKNTPGDKYELFDYTFNENPEFAKKYFIPSDIEMPRRRRVTQTRPRPKNELLLRNAQRSLLYAFEGWPTAEVYDDSGPGGPV
ncbi:MAG TPA: sphingomyelin phosphodiesterase [Pyrinomonadaceae bacterium]